MPLFKGGLQNARKPADYSSMLSRALVSIAIVCGTSDPALAGTTIHAVNGVEIIVSGREVPAIAAQSRAARPAHDIATARATTGLRGAPSLIATALGYLGTPYVWGGAAPGGFDCSGFTYYVYARMGIRIPRTADVQFAAGRPVVGDPLPGDLVFFQTYDYGASHVGIYLGEGRFVNSIGASVHVATFGSTYFRERYIGARRFLPA